MFQGIYEDSLNFYHPNKCIGDLGEKWCNFKWRIWNLHLNPKRRIQSPVFTTRLLPNMHWYFKVELLYPEDLRSIEISLNRLRKRENTALTVDVYFKVICDKKVIVRSMDTYEYDPELLWEYGRIYTVPFYKTKNNYLIVDCKLRPNKTMIQNVYHQKLDESLSIHLRRLLRTGELFDTFIRVENYQLKAHIAILQARLPQLLKKCRSPTKVDGKYIVNINDDLTFPIVKEMLKYAYTGQAYVDVETFSISKDVYVSYGQNFFQSCCWEDHPSAETFFNYETDSLSWHLKDVFKKSNLGSQSIEFLKLLPNKFTFSLDVDESEKAEKWLMITIQFLHKMPKPTIVSCNTLLINRESNEKLELGDSKSLLDKNITERKMKLCSLLDVKKGVETLCATANSLDLRTDMKFCCGSSRSSIENIYEGEFDITKCTGCPRLSADMKVLFTTPHFYDIIVESGDGVRFLVHKAILLARWPEADERELKKITHVVIADNQNRNVYDFLSWLYTGRM